MKKKAFITGITGMDGSHLADLLLSYGYEVHGLIRRASNFNTKRIEHIFSEVHLHYGDMTDALSLQRLIEVIEPDEIYNLAAMSHVQVSFLEPQYTFETNTIGLLNLLTIVKNLDEKRSKMTKIYHASTSEMFGNVKNDDDNENENDNHERKTISKLNLSMPLLPVSPYGISKLSSHLLCSMFREAYNMFIVSSVLFNHESERRGETFITQKIATYVCRFKDFMLSSSLSTTTISSHEQQQQQQQPPPLAVGNLDAKRDWGYAVDYVKGIFLMLQKDFPKDYILATGETHSVREFIEIAFAHIGYKIEWKKHQLPKDEEGWINDKIKVVVVNPSYYRPIDINILIGDASEAHKELNWKPSKTFTELVHWMVDRNGF